MARALRYIREIGASYVVPSAGPPCFLDDHLFYFNDFDRNPANTFPDQTVFIDYMKENGKDNGRLMIPGGAWWTVQVRSWSSGSAICTATMRASVRSWCPGCGTRTCPA